MTARRPTTDGTTGVLVLLLTLDIVAAVTLMRLGWFGAALLASMVAAHAIAEHALRALSAAPRHPSKAVAGVALALALTMIAIAGVSWFHSRLSTNPAIDVAGTSGPMAVPLGSR